MPQLNPNPWFYIMFLSWLIILVILPQKINSFKHLTDPFYHPSNLSNTKHWTWPWI
uniref:ATP synthase complex subunit 8 n=1 Tax=Leptobrachella pelodytoides TaxID=164310 RepID=S4V016_9ANUR|nr:ATP synthase F0 subunit 8 [Leptobrachella pelodytoides]